MNSYQLRFALIEMSKSIPVYVCAADELQLINIDRFAIIVNIDTSKNPGRHWVAFFRPTKSSDVEFFDSFGLDFSKYGMHFTKFVSKFHEVDQSLFQIQSLNSNVCGMYCIYFLKMRMEQVSYNDILNRFFLNQRRNNDSIVRKFVSSIRFPRFSNCQKQCLKKCKIKTDRFSTVCFQKSKRCYRLSLLNNINKRNL